MAGEHHPETAAGTAVEPIVDPLSLRDRDGVDFHEDAETVDSEQIDALAELDDMAVVGVTNDEGKVLLRRLTETCSWKLPVGTVEAGEDFTEAARAAVEDDLGLPVAFESVKSAVHYEDRTEDGRSATRSFVVYGASPASTDARLGDLHSEADDGPADVGWYDELPEGASELPGTELFF